MRHSSPFVPPKPFRFLPSFLSGQPRPLLPLFFISYGTEQQHVHHTLHQRYSIRRETKDKQNINTSVPVRLVASLEKNCSPPFLTLGSQTILKLELPKYNYHRNMRFDKSIIRLTKVCSVIICSTGRKVALIS